MQTLPKTNHNTGRRGFTLIELLVAITIFTILVTIAIGAFTETNYDRASNAALQLRGMFEGARSRAIHDGQVRGVRLVPDPNGGNFYTSLQYVGAPGHYEGRFTGVTWDATASVWNVTGDWTNLVQRELLLAGTTVRVEIPSYSGRWYLFSPSSATGGTVSGMIEGARWDGTTYVYSRTVTAMAPVPVRFELLPLTLPGSRPQALPNGMGISADLTLTTNPGVSDLGGLPMDDTLILFSPRGEVLGRSATQGVLHFFVGDTRDLSVYPGTSVAAHAADIEGDDRIVTVYTRTGSINTAPVNRDGTLGAPLYWYYFANSGEEIK